MNEERQSPSFFLARIFFFLRSKGSSKSENGRPYIRRKLSTLFLTLSGYFFVFLFLVSDFADNAFFIIFKPFFY